MVHLSLTHSYHCISSGCPQYMTLQLFILARKNIHSSAAPHPSLSVIHHPWSRLGPHLPSSPVTYISFPSPLSYGASTLNQFASTQPVFTAGSTGSWKAAFTDLLDEFEGVPKSTDLTIYGKSYVHNCHPNTELKESFTVLLGRSPPPCVFHSWSHR